MFRNKNKLSKTSLKYSAKLRAVGFGGFALAAAESSAAVVDVPVGVYFPTSAGFVSFEANGTNFVASYDTSFSGFVRPCGLTLGSFSPANFGWTASGIFAVLMSPGDMVDSSLNFSAATNTFGTVPASGQTIFIGYQLANAGPGGNETFYGYIQLTGGGGTTFTVDRYAFENSAGTGILVIPEPTSAFLVGISTLLVTCRRRRLRS